MVDPGIGLAVVRQLNRWYRKRAKPHGTMDHCHRGTRMSYTAAYRAVNVSMGVLMISFGTLLSLVPGIMEGKSPLVVLLVKLGWVGILCVAVLAPMQALRECVVITDEGLIKLNLLGRETRMAWRDVSHFQINDEDNKVTLRAGEKTKLTMSLAYDGWQDFLAVAAKRLNPILYAQFHYTLTNLDARPKRVPKKK